jgi:chemotaxis signal transduction protein
MPLFAVEALRREFDAAFARPVREAAEATEDLLEIRVAGSPYALRVAELGGVSAGHRVTAVPSAQAALLGLVGIRGVLVPVFDLARLLGESALEEAPRWVALSRGDSPVGLAFASVDGHLTVSPSALQASAGGGQTLVEQLVRSEAGLRPIVSVGKVLSLLRGGAGADALEKGKGD